MSACNPAGSYTHPAVTLPGLNPRSMQEDVPGVTAEYFPVPDNDLPVFLFSTDPAPVISGKDHHGILHCTGCPQSDRPVLKMPERDNPAPAVVYSHG